MPQKGPVYFMVKKDFIASKICICFASAMTALSLLLNSILYRESLMTELKKKIDKRFLMDTPDIRSIHEAEDESENVGEMVIIERRDIADRLRSYNKIINISNLKSVINTLLIAGLGLSGIFGVFGLIKKALSEKE